MAVNDLHVDRGAKAYSTSQGRGETHGATGSGLADPDDAVLRGHRDEIRALRSDRDQLRGKLLEAQQLECASDMATGISDELGHLATAMMGHAERLGDDASLEAIRFTAERAASLSRQLQNLFHADPCQRGINDLDEAVEKLSGTLRQLLPARITLVVIPFGERLSASIQLGELSLILTELVLNARAAIVDEGSVTVSIGSEPADPVTALSGTPALSRNVVQVIDTGCGMDAETVEMACEPFFTTQATGKGLGLTAVRQLTDTLSGSMTIDSAPGWGTAISISLPQASTD